MSDLHYFGDATADDALLDAIGARDYAGNDPLAGMLLAYAMACDAPSPAMPIRARRRRRAVLGAFASAAFIISGAGVAAAMSDSLPTVQQLFAGGGAGGFLGRLGTVLTAVNPVEAAVNVVSGGAAVPALNARGLAVPAASSAVSYTHLDVYKRQARGSPGTRSWHSRHGCVGRSLVRLRGGRTPPG